MQRSRSAIKSYQVFGDVSSEFRCIVSEAVVCQLRLVVVVLPLVQEGYQPHFALLYTHTPIDVQLTLPDTLTRLVIRLYERTKVIRDDGVSSLVHEFC